MKHLLIPGCVFLMIACNGSKQASQEPPLQDDTTLEGTSLPSTQGTEASAPEVTAVPARVVIYKTHTDRTQNVPVLLSESGERIISYPHPTDVSVSGSSPTPLVNGYLLDNRGIGPTVAFLDMNYGEYAELDNAPTLAEMGSRLIDRDPLEEMYDCGTRNEFADLVGELTALISSGSLEQRCKRIK